MSDINDAMNATIRQIFAKVRLTLTDPYFSGGVDVSSPTGVGRETYLDQTADNVETTAFKWFSLHRNVLDGTFHPLPTGKEYSVGWWGTVLSDVVTREFTPNPVLQITVAPRTVSDLLVVGDDKLDEYPTDFVIRLYSAGDYLEKTVTVTGNSDVSWTQSIPSETEIVKMTLTIEKWSRASAVSKIIQFFTAVEQLYYSEDGDLVSIRVNEEREYAGATIPQGNISSSSITVRFNNITDLFSPGNSDSRLYGLLKNNRAIKAWLGVDLPAGREWYPLGLFYSRDWSAPEDEIWAEVTGLDTLDRLRLSTFSSSTVYENKTLQELAIIILTDAGLTAVDWDIDPALDAIVVPFAWFEPMSHREALRRIAAAALGQVYCDRDGVIIVEIYSVPATSSFTFDQSNIFSVDHPLKWAQMVNYVEAQAQPREKQAEQVICTDIEPFTVPGSGTVTKTHFFIAAPCLIESATPVVLTDADTDITVDSWTPYAWGMMVTYTNSNVADEEVRQVNISGKPLTVVGGKVAVAQDATSIADNGKQSLGEPLASEFWQTEARAQAAANAILASYKDPRRDVTMRARGNIGIHLGDRVIAPDYKDVASDDFAIMRQDIQWDGGLDITVGAQRISAAMYCYKKGISAGVAVVGSFIHHEVTLVVKSLISLATVAVVLAKQASNFYKTFSGLVSVTSTIEHAWDFAVGAGAIDRSTAAGEGITYIALANPSTAAGILDTVELWFSDACSAATSVRVGTFYSSGDAGYYTCRDSVVLGSVAVGSKQTRTGLSLAVEVGDVLGIYFEDGCLEMSGVGSGAGYYYDNTGERFYDYSWEYSHYESGRDLSLHATGHAT